MEENEINKDLFGNFYKINYFIALNSFSSTPRFIKDLTDLSIEIISSSNKEDALKEGLEKIN